MGTVTASSILQELNTAKAHIVPPPLLQLLQPLLLPLLLLQLLLMKAKASANAAAALTDTTVGASCSCCRYCNFKHCQTLMAYNSLLLKYELCAIAVF